MSDSKPLTAKQEAFAREYVANKFNATQAAVSAGYGEDGAAVEGTRLLRIAKVKDFIDELMSGAVAKTTLKAERLIELVQDGIEFDFTEWFDLDESGHITLICRLSDLPPNVRRLIQGFKQTKFGVEVQFVSKSELLAMGARFLGMNKDQIKVTTELESKTDEEILEELKAAAGRGIDFGAIAKQDPS